MFLYDFQFYGHHYLEKYHIPNDITKIGSCCFMSCSNLTEVFLPDCLKEIGKCAFSDCNNLYRIQFPESVFYIDDNAFLRCSALTKLVLPKNMILIGKEAFGGCRNIEYIKMPDNIVELNRDAFLGCSPKEIEFRGHIYNNIESFYKAYDIYKEKEESKKVYKSTLSLDKIVEINTKEKNVERNLKEIER